MPDLLARVHLRLGAGATAANQFVHAGSDFAI